MPQSSCDNHQEKSATPTFIDVAPASKIDIERKNHFKIRNNLEMLPQGSCDNHQKKECVIQDSGKDVENSSEFSLSIDKFCRAARVLGVCLPAKELHSYLQMQKGGGNNYEFSLKRKTLLRI